VAAGGEAVFVWFPGGAFEQGSGADCDLYDGAAMASRQSVVTVTVTYVKRTVLLLLLLLYYY